MKNKSCTCQKIYEIVSKIPRGKVSTYKTLALKVGCGPRYVGWCLHHNNDPLHVPCHRVVNSQGKVAKTFAFGGGNKQQQLLENEGVIFSKNKIKLKDYLW